MKDLAPQIFRQRLAIEGIYETFPSKEQWVEYLNKLSEVLGMQIVHGPFVDNRAEQAKPKEFDGWEWFAIRTTSGVHMYVRERDEKLLTVDIYTCRWFDPQVAVEFTKNFFQLIEVVHSAQA